MQENLGAAVINCGSFEWNKFNHRRFYYYADHKTRYYRTAGIKKISAACQKARSINPRFYRTEIDTERILFPRPIHLSIFLFLPDKTDRAWKAKILIQQLFSHHYATGVCDLQRYVIGYAAVEHSGFIIGNWQTNTVTYTSQAKPCNMQTFAFVEIFVNKVQFTSFQNWSLNIQTIESVLIISRYLV